MKGLISLSSVHRRIFLLDGLLPNTYILLFNGDEDLRGEDYCLFKGEWPPFSLHLGFLFEENSPFLPLFVFFNDPFLGDGDP